MLVALYLVPLADVLVTSVTDPKPGLDNYALLFTSASVQRTLLTTLRIAAITTLLALVLGYLVAYPRVTHSRRTPDIFCEIGILLLDICCARLGIGRLNYILEKFIWFRVNAAQAPHKSCGRDRLL